MFGFCAMDYSIILLFALLIPVLTYPYGAGPSACTTLVPGHRFNPQPAGTLPFLIEPEADHFILNRLLKVRILPTLAKYKNRKFGGFFLQARAPDGSEAVGHWIAEGEGHITTRNCSHPADSITHAHARPKGFDIVLYFLPTGDMPERIQFMGSIARDFSTYWTNVRSSVISRFTPQTEISHQTPVATQFPDEIHNVTHNNDDTPHNATVPLVLHGKESERESSADDNDTSQNNDYGNITTTITVFR